MQSTASVSQKRVTILFSVLGFVAAFAVAGWVAGSRIESPADAAARTAPPTPSPILVPVEERVLSTNIVTRGTARYGLPRPISIPPSPLKTDAGLITTLPLRNAQIAEGGVLLTASGRPLFVLRGAIPIYRDLTPGIAGEDVRQLEQGLKRLGFDPGPIDGHYDQRTGAAVEKWYKAAGWEPFGPTRDQIANIRTIERDLEEATKYRLSATTAESTSALSVASARATAEHNNKTAAADLAAKTADLSKLAVNGKDKSPLMVSSERAKAEYAETAAKAEVAAQIADRALIVLDPRQTETARAAAEAKLQLAQAAALKTELESELAVQTAERDAKLAVEQFKMAETAIKSAQLAGEMAVRSALDTQRVANLDARLASERVHRLTADLLAAKSKLGIQIPIDEIVFIPDLPVRVEEVTAHIGDAARGPVLTVTDNQLVITSSLPLEAAPLVKPGMSVSIDEQALGIKAAGVVEMVANSPGTHGVDGYHIYYEVRVDKAPMRLEGFSLRLTMPIKSTAGAVTAVPLSAVSLSADGKSRVQLENEGVMKYVVVNPGLSADGYVEVSAVDGKLTPGQLVVVGYENPETQNLP